MIWQQIRNHSPRKLISDLYTVPHIIKIELSQAVKLIHGCIASTAGSLIFRYVLVATQGLFSHRGSEQKRSSPVTSSELFAQRDSKIDCEKICGVPYALPGQVSNRFRSTISTN